mmetsp:Transcript_69381/g.174856  ORF Transcript_69381/g.174856 Transcript_69381/m.174856 type:complete len:291 (+) Transcript_69381:175-1047(+)
MWRYEASPLRAECARRPELRELCGLQPTDAGSWWWLPRGGGLAAAGDCGSELLLGGRHSADDGCLGGAARSRANDGELWGQLGRCRRGYGSDSATPGGRAGPCGGVETASASWGLRGRRRLSGAHGPHLGCRGGACRSHPHLVVCRGVGHHLGQGGRNSACKVHPRWARGVLGGDVEGVRPGERGEPLVWRHGADLRGEGGEQGHDPEVASVPGQREHIEQQAGDASDACSRGRLCRDNSFVAAGGRRHHTAGPKWSNGFDARIGGGESIYGLDVPRLRSQPAVHEPSGR